MIREKTLKKLKQEAAGSGYVRLSARIGISMVTLWRIVNDKFKGNATTWDAIFKYYGK